MTAEKLIQNGQIRATDSNSLLRLHDRACRIAAGSASQFDRLRADKTRQRIAHELVKRKVSL